MASNNPPRQLNINCTVSAIFLPEIGSQAGLYARYAQQPDKANTLTATYYEQIERDKYSPGLSRLATGPGGIIPKINTFIGAPAATFAEGSIKPETAHPVCSLLMGAKSSKFTQATYSLPANAIERNIKSATSTSTSTSSTSIFPSGNYPYIPLAKVGPFTSLEARTTYNIWKQLYVDQAKIKYTIPVGANYKPASKSAAAIQTNFSINGSRITVSAQKKSCNLRRIFPIADDLLYESPDIYYPIIDGVSKPKDTVKAKGGPNCGFWINLKIPSGQNTSVSSKGVEIPRILIYWGAENKEKSKRRITEFVLVLDAGKPTLRYKKPGVESNNTITDILKNWGKIDLPSSPESSIKNSELNIYVHYAGPNMYIGFDSDINQWNLFEPIRVDQMTKDTSDDAIYEPYQPKESIIEINFNNIVANFSYSPICFTNFNAEYLTSTNTVTKNKIDLEFNIEEKEYLTGSCSPVKLTENLLKHRKPKSEPTPPPEGTQQEFFAPTYYGDWRRFAGETAEDDAKYEAELSYEEISVVSDTSIEDNKRRYVKGKINYETTIEGPIFFYIRNFSEASQRNRIIRPIWNNFSDISSYLSDVSVSVTNSVGVQNDNRSYKTSRATFTLANLTNDLVGIQILNALQENVLVFTLKAGFEKEMNTFFQGVTRNIRVNRTPDGFTVTVECEDLGDVLLNDIRFNTSSSHSFNFNSFKQIFEDSFYFAGLSKVYEPRPKITTGYDVLYQNYFNKHIGAFGLNYQSSLIAQVITVNKNVKIANVIKLLLQYMWYTTEDQVKGNYALPILYWNPEKHRFVLSTRGEEGEDELFFAGDTSDPSGIIQLPNSNPEREHGTVDSRGWTESTNVERLYSNVIFSSNTFNHTPVFFQSGSGLANQGLGTNPYNNLNSFVQNPATNDNISNFQSPPPVGYVGYNKEYYSVDEINNFYQNENFARELFLSKVNFARSTYTSLNLNVYVTKPLSTSGTFIVKSFDGGSENKTASYIYAKVDYKFDLNNNIITAAILGEKFADILSS